MEIYRKAAVWLLRYPEEFDTAAYYAKPLHSQSAYRNYPVAGNGLPVCDRLAYEVLSLPMHPYLDENTQDRIAGALRAALRD